MRVSVLFLYSKRIKWYFDILAIARNLKLVKNQKSLFYKAIQIIQNGLLGMLVSNKYVGAKWVER